MLENEAAQLRDALKRFDAWVGQLDGGKDGHIAADVRMIAARARDHLGLHDQSGAVGRSAWQDGPSERVLETERREAAERERLDAQAKIDEQARFDAEAKAASANAI